MRWVLLIGLVFSFGLQAKLEEHFKPALNKVDLPKVKNIDYIYMINLDQRPEKFERSLQQLAPWGIVPYRFSAVNGWELTLETVTDVGIKYRPKMLKGTIQTTYYEAENWKLPKHEYPHKIGRTYFSHCFSLGAIGICLSHLSILQDAWDAGYETIWVMEDDVEVIRSPHMLSDLITELDQAVGKNGWDILFTDRDTKNNKGEYVPCMGYAWRPNFEPIDKTRFAKRTIITPNLRQIGARFGAYSMIVRRSGMKKLLDFFKRYQLFLPYDIDFALPNTIKLFSVIDDVVSTKPGSPSDNGGPNYRMGK